MSLTKSDIIPIFLKFLSQIKVYHWQTRNYARHVASDNLHIKLSTLIDNFIETYQGKRNRDRLMLPTDTALTIQNLNDDEIEEYLFEFKSFLMQELPTILPEGMTNPDLLNIRDEMVSTVNQTLYLFSLN